MKPVVLIGHDAWETFGLAPAALRAEGLDVRIHNAREDGPPPDVDEVGGIIVFGGEMNVDETGRFPFLAAERDLTKRAIDRGVPFLGICLGAQMLARAQDVPVVKAPVREIGFAALHLTAKAAPDPLMSVFSDGDMVFHWHEDTFALSDGAVLLGTGDHVRVQAFRVGERAWGLQFHFEVDRDELEMWLSDADDGLKEAWGKSADELRAEADLNLSVQEDRARELFRRFAREVRAAG
ncbi:MAG: type 1 glutamine amidotransferase [Actinomycetota bacterium]